MSPLLDRIALCIEFGKIDLASPYPPDMKGQEGADELTKQALQEGVPPEDVLNKGFVVGMDKVGKKFSENKVFVPQLLMSAKAMSTAMKHIRPFFQSGEVKRKGVLVIGTIFGDMHDIGKNLVAMMVEGAGYEVIDLGVDVKTDTFMKTIEQHPGCAIGMSAMLTTTMMNMKDVVIAVKGKYPKKKILVGGAPINQEFCEKIEADFYSPDPQGAVNYLNSMMA